MFVLLGPLDYEEFATRRGCFATDRGAWVAGPLALMLFDGEHGAGPE